MKRLQKSYFKGWIVPSFCGLLLLQWHCTHPPAGPEVALYAFVYQGERYRIRSVYSPEGESFNELIGPGFLARDVDQNGTLDQVLFGSVSLSEAQKVYVYALNELRMQNRLKEIGSEERIYKYQNSKFAYEIKTLVSWGKIYSNTFKVLELGPSFQPEVAMAKDREADGVLDEIVKGKMLLTELQAMYETCISKGLEEKKLVKENGLIIVR